MARLSNGWARCQVRSCEMEAPLCGCAVPRPMVQRHNRKTGHLFWGCQRHGSGDGCKKTKKWQKKSSSKLPA